MVSMLTFLPAIRVRILLTPTYIFFHKFVFLKNENNLKRAQGWPIFKKQLLIVRRNILGSLRCMMMMIMKQNLSQRPVVVKSHSVPRLTPPANTFYVFIRPNPRVPVSTFLFDKNSSQTKKLKKYFLRGKIILISNEQSRFQNVLRDLARQPMTK